MISWYQISIQSTARGSACLIMLDPGCMLTGQRVTMLMNRMCPLRNSNMFTYMIPNFVPDWKGIEFIFVCITYHIIIKPLLSDVDLLRWYQDRTDRGSIP